MSNNLDHNGGPPLRPDIQCPECAALFQPKKSDAVFCSKACKNTQGNRELVRGRAIYRDAYIWAMTGGRVRVVDGALVDGAAAFRRMGATMREYVQQDKRRGRREPPRQREL